MEMVDAAPKAVKETKRCAAVPLVERTSSVLEIVEGIVRGERALLAGRIVSHAVAKRRLRRWLEAFPGRGAR